MDSLGDTLEPSPAGEGRRDPLDYIEQKIDADTFMFIANQTPSLKRFVHEYGMDTFMDRVHTLNEMATGKPDGCLDLILFHFVIQDIMEEGLCEERKEEQMTIMQEWFSAIFRSFSGDESQAQECREAGLQG